MSDSQDAKNQKRAKAAAIARTVPGADGLYDFSAFKDAFDYGDNFQIPEGGRFKDPGGLDAWVNGGFGFGGIYEDSPISAVEYMQQTGMTPRQFAEQFQSVPFRWNDDGTVSYDPSAQKNIYEYRPASYDRNAKIGIGGILALATAGLAAGAMGGAGAGAGEVAAGGAMDMGVGLGGSLGPWGGITPIAEGAAAATAGAGGAAGGSLWETAKSLTSALPSLDKLTTGSKLADSVIASSIVGALSGGGGKTDDSLEKFAEQQRADQAALDSRIADGTTRINNAFSGYDDDYYSGVAKAYRDHYTPLLDEQAATAKRRVVNSWPGGSGTSGYARRMSELTRDIERQQADIASQSVDFSNQRKQQVESNRSSLMSQLQGGASADAVASQATSQAATLNTPPAYSPLGDLFARYTSIPANMVLARNAGYTSGATPTRFSVKNPVSVVA